MLSAVEKKNMREKVQKAYKGDSWRLKVEAMDDKQLLAVYKRLLRCGAIKGATR
jgi:hypothetical protein